MSLGRPLDHAHMKFTPQTTEGWERFWLISLGTVVLGLAIFFAQFTSAYFVRRSYGDWPLVALSLATAALGIYSAALLRRGHIILAVIGFAMFVVGVWWSLSTLTVK